MSRLVLIDFSSIARPIYEASGNSPNIDQVSIDIVARIRSLTGNDPHVAICCDSGRSFRKDISADYKAQRPETPAPYLHQCSIALDVLRGDGFPVWEIKGFEADDIIATAVSFAKDDSATCGWCGEHHEGGPECCDGHAMIVTGDKDMHQLISERVEIFKPAVGKNPAVTYDFENFETQHAGLKPSQIVDYLALVGDASDNVKGADGIGPKKAAALLTEYGNLDDLYEAMDKGRAESIALKPAMHKSLVEFYPRMAEVRSLLTLRTDAPIPFEEIFRPRVPADTTIPEDDMTDDINEAMPTLERPHDEGRYTQSASETTRAGLSEGTSATETRAAITTQEARQGMDEPRTPNQKVSPTAVSNGAALVSQTPIEWERQLEPQNWEEAIKFANLMFKSRFFSQWGHVEQAVAIVAAGRELGVPGMASLRSFHNMAGKPTLSASLMRGLVLRSGKAEYFQCIERTPTRSTWRTLRKGNPQPTELTYTIEEAKAAWTQGEAAWQKSNWVKIPADMCSARSSSKLARLDYDDVLLGLYASEEFDQ